MSGLMKFAQKDFGWYMRAIKWPLISLAAWTIAGAIILRVSLTTYLDVFGNQLIAFFLPAIVYLLAGYLATADLKAKGAQGAWAGALVGFIIGLLGIITTVVNLPSLLDLGVQQAIAAAGAQGQAISAGDVEPMLRVVLIIGAVIGPFISGLIGAFFGWLGHLIARNVEDQKE